MSNTSLYREFAMLLCNFTRGHFEKEALSSVQLKLGLAADSGSVVKRRCVYPSEEYILPSISDSNCNITNDCVNYEDQFTIELAVVKKDHLQSHAFYMSYSKDLHMLSGLVCQLSKHNITKFPEESDMNTIIKILHTVPIAWIVTPLCIVVAIVFGCVLYHKKITCSAGRHDQDETANDAML